jgi:hypothetical protein
MDIEEAAMDRYAGVINADIRNIINETLGNPSINRELAFSILRSLSRS